jgi:radical SAM superfamily enzyme YgiQ (UPF0313 family)
MRLSLLDTPCQDPNEATPAYQAFLQSLPIRQPRELILINPQLVPREAFDPVIASNKGYYAFPPVGLLYIAAVAHEVFPELKIRVLDLNYEMLCRGQKPDFHYEFWQDLLREELDACEAPFVGVTCMFGATKPVFLDVSRWLSENYPQVPILAGGVQATYDFQELLEQQYCHVLFRREAELQFKAFLEGCKGVQPTPVPRGCAFRLDGRVYELGDPEGNVPIEWDIRSYYDLIPVESYNQVGSLAAFSRFNGASKPFATVLAKRGCRAHCTFCTVRDFNGKGVRNRTPQNVIDEIKFLVEEKGIQQIDWLDDDLLWDPHDTLALFKGLAEQVPQLEWISNNGLIAAAISDEIMEWMVKSGLRAFKIGIESGNDDVLKVIQKPTTKPKLRIKRRLFRKYPEVFVSANFIIGFPKETFGQMMDSYEFASELEWDWSSFYICQPLKGTEMFNVWQALGDERCEEEGYDKTLNPGRAAARGEFGYQFDGTNRISTGKAIFDLPRDLVPGKEQLKEIWFTFNLVANFINNLNFYPGGRPEKLVRWFESIAHAYPYDASMVAALARGYRLMGDQATFELNRGKFHDILANSPYWQRRIQEFPELELFVESADSVPPYIHPQQTKLSKVS